MHQNIFKWQLQKKKTFLIGDNTQLSLILDGFMSGSCTRYFPPKVFIHWHFHSLSLSFSLILLSIIIVHLLLLLFKKEKLKNVSNYFFSKVYLYAFAIMPNSRHNYMCTEFTTTNRTFYRFVKVKFGLFLFSSFFLNSLRKLLLLIFFSYIKSWYVLFTRPYIYYFSFVHAHIHERQKQNTYCIAVIDYINTREMFTYICMDNLLTSY